MSVPSVVEVLLAQADALEVQARALRAQAAVLADARSSGAGAPAVPALVTAKNAELVGLTPRQFADALRAMRRDLAWADRVIVSGKLRAVAPADLIAFLRARTPAKSSHDRIKRWFGA